MMAMQAAEDAKKPSAGAGEDAKFIAAAKYEGSKPGYIFTTRADGTGYYRDHAEITRKENKRKREEAPPPPAKGTAPRSAYSVSASSGLKAAKKKAAALKANKEEAPADDKKKLLMNAYLDAMKDHESQHCGGDHTQGAIVK